MPRRIESLIKEIVHRLGEGILEVKPPKPLPTVKGGAAPAPVVDTEKKPGRAFIHKLTGKYLAESGNESQNHVFSTMGLERKNHLDSLCTKPKSVHLSSSVRLSCQSARPDIGMERERKSGEFNPVVNFFCICFAIASTFQCVRKMQSCGPNRFPVQTHCLWLKFSCIGQH